MEKNIVIVGGSRGIGLESAKILAEEHQVFVLARTSDELADVNVKFLEFDATKDDIKQLDLPEKIHGFIYCPGSINLKPFKMLKPEDFVEEIQLNFISLIKCLQGILSNLKTAEQASVVFFSTVAVKLGMPFHTSVAASKGAIEGFARSMAAEYAPTLRVNVIAPSLTNTSLSQKLLNSEEKKQKMKDRHPLKQIGEATDIANLAAFLISDKSSWITGQVMGIDGGLSTINMN